MFGLLIQNQMESFLDTFELLSLPLVGQAILEHKADVLVFKNTGQIERLSKERGWNLLNPRAYLSKNG